MEVKYIDHMGSDLSVVNAARVSFGKVSHWETVTDPHHGGQIPPYNRLSNRDSALIRYLASHGHHSPFNHTYITMHVKAPIFVARQLVKHKFMPWNEISRRYVDDPPEFYWPDVWRGKSEDKKQGSEGTILMDPTWVREIQDTCDYIYDTMITEGVAPEQARMVLPQNTYTEWYWSGTLHAWSEMYNLRSKSDTQLETQVIANQAGEILKDLYPVSWEELTE